MYLVGVDVGYTNLGLVSLTVDDEYKVTQVDVIKKVNIARMTHDHVPYEECKLPHTFNTCDLVMHFIQEHKHIFDRADTVFIERQPPGGLKDVEACIAVAYRPKMEFVSPNTMHKHFNIGHMDYEQRKVETTKIAEVYLDVDIPYARKHDVADAVCMIKMFCDKMIKQRRVEKIRGTPFEAFRYVPQGIFRRS